MGHGVAFGRDLAELPHGAAVSLYELDEILGLHYEQGPCAGHASRACGIVSIVDYVILPEHLASARNHDAHACGLASLSLAQGIVQLYLRSRPFLWLASVGPSLRCPWAQIRGQRLAIYVFANALPVDLCRIHKHALSLPLSKNLEITVDYDIHVLRSVTLIVNVLVPLISLLLEGLQKLPELAEGLVGEGRDRGKEIGLTVRDPRFNLLQYSIVVVLAQNRKLAFGERLDSCASASLFRGFEGQLAEDLASSQPCCLHKPFKLLEALQVDQVGLLLVREFQVLLAVEPVVLRGLLQSLGLPGLHRILSLCFTGRKCWWLLILNLF